MDHKQEITRISDFVEIDDHFDKSVHIADTDEFRNFVEVVKNISESHSLIFESTNEAQNEILGSHSDPEKFSQEHMSKMSVSIQNFLKIVDNTTYFEKYKKNIKTGVENMVNEMLNTISSFERKSEKLYNDKYVVSIALYPLWVFNSSIRLFLGNVKGKKSGKAEVPIGDIFTLMNEKINCFDDMSIMKQFMMTTVRLAIRSRKVSGDKMKHLAAVIYCQNFTEILSVPRTLADMCKRDHPIDRIILEGYDSYQNSESESQIDKGIDTIKNLAKTNSWSKIQSRLSRIAEDIGERHFGDPQKLKLDIPFDSSIIDNLSGTIKSVAGNFFSEDPSDETSHMDEDQKSRAKEIRDLQQGRV